MGCSFMIDDITASTAEVARSSVQRLSFPAASTFTKEVR